MPAITQPVLDNDLGLADFNGLGFVSLDNDLGFVGFDNHFGHGDFDHANADNDSRLISWGLDRI